MQTRWLSAAALAGLLSATALPASGATILSDFTTDLDGWTQVGAAVYQQQATGGNPGGFLYLDNNESVIAYIIAPSKFLGDLRAFDGGVVSFDGILLGSGGSPWTNAQDYGHLTVSGPGGSATADLVPMPALPTATWTTYSLDFTAANFGKTPTEWDAILSNVTDLRISVEALFGNEIEGIDNVQLASVPEPSAVALLVGAAAALAVRRRPSR